MNEITSFGGTKSSEVVADGTNVVLSFGGGVIGGTLHTTKQGFTLLDPDTQADKFLVPLDYGAWVFQELGDGTYLGTLRW